MKDLQHIDELLKQNFDGFAPQAPDVWSGVQQGLNTAAQAGNVASNAAGAVKAGSVITSKIILVAGSVAVLSGALITYTVYKGNDKAGDKVSLNTTAAQENKTITTTPAAVPGETTPLLSTIPAEDRHTEASAPHKKTGASHVAAEQKNEEAHAQDMTNAPSLQDNQSPFLAPPAETKTDKPVVSQDPAPGANMVKESSAGKTEESSADTKTAGTPPEGPLQERDGDYLKPTIPNVFTPNNDGYNDRFIILIDNESAYHLVIRDQKWNIVFESFDKKTVWDGNHIRSGQACEAGTYFYQFNYQLKTDDKARGEEGLLKLIR